MANERLTTAEAEAFLRASVLWRLDTAARFPTGTAGSTYAIGAAVGALAEAGELFAPPDWPQAIAGAVGIGFPHWAKGYLAGVQETIDSCLHWCRTCPAWPRRDKREDLLFLSRVCANAEDFTALRDSKAEAWKLEMASVAADCRQIESGKLPAAAWWEYTLHWIAGHIRGLYWQPMLGSAYRDLARLADLGDTLGLGNLQQVRTMTERLIAEGHGEIRDLADVMAALDAADTKARAGNSAVGGLLNTPPKSQATVRRAMSKAEKTTKLVFELREDPEMSAAELGRRLGVTRQTVYNWADGPDTLEGFRRTLRSDGRQPRRGYRSAETGQADGISLPEETE